MQWQLQEADLRRTWGVDPDLRPWTCMPDVRLQGFGIPDTTRARALMDLAAIDHLGPKCAAGLVQEAKQCGCWSKIKQALADVYVDLSQNPYRKPWTNSKTVSRCMTTSSCIYSFAEQRVVTPVEMMFWQGHPRSFNIPQSMSQASLAALAGEGMFLPSLASILWALVCSGNLPGMRGNRC